MREAAASDYRWSSIILGIVKSVPFQMRRSELMIITKKAMSRRRTVLCAASAPRVALPLLDSMVPAFGAVARGGRGAVRRLGVVYVPNGMVMPRVDAEGRGRRLRAPATSEAARAVPRSAARADRPDSMPPVNAAAGAGMHARARPGS